MSTNLIVLAGTARCGKTTVANLIKSHYEAMEEACHVVPLGFYVKQELAEILGIPVEDQERDRTRWRVIWQVWGTEVRRDLFGYGYWLHQWVTYAPMFEGHLVVPDVRFINEINDLAKFAERNDMAFRPVRVQRSWLWEAEQWLRKQRWHSSERQWREKAKGFPWVLKNTSDLRSLEQQVSRMVGQWV